MSVTVRVQPYAAVLGARLVLTCATIGLAYVDLGLFSPMVALGIAGVKAVLVGLFFMHLRYTEPLTRLSAAAGVVVFALLLGLVLLDWASRPSVAAFPSAQVAR